MVHSTRNALLAVLLVVAWSMSSERLLSRALPDEPMDDSASESPASAEDPEGQVNRLLVRLYGMLKKSWLEIKDLNRQAHQTSDIGERETIRQEINSKISHVEGKGREYLELVPQLRSNYPRLKSLLASFTRDVRSIMDGLQAVRSGGMEDGVDSEVPAARSASRSRSPLRQWFSGKDRSKDEAPAAEPAPRQEASVPRRKAPDAEADYESSRGHGAPGGIGDEAGMRGIAGAMGVAPGGDSPIEEPRDPSMLPVVLEVHGPKDATVTRHRVRFQLTPESSGLVRGIVEGNGTVQELEVLTNGQGRARVLVQLKDPTALLRVRRTVRSQADHTLCKLTFSRRER